MKINCIFLQADASLLHQSQQYHSRRSSKNSAQFKDKGANKNATRFDFDKIEAFAQKPEEKPKTSSSTERESIGETDPKSPNFLKGDVTAATFLDVAVLRCLFISHWQEEGVYWSLHYLYNR